MRRRITEFLAGLVALTASATFVRAEPVDLALVLAVDVSGSINEAEYQLQIGRAHV